MSLAVAILMKDPTEAKSRLKPALGDDARERIALLLFENTLGFFRRFLADVALGVVTSSERIAALARAAGAESVVDQGDGINAAAGDGARWAKGLGAESLLIVHADIPTFADSEVTALLEAGRTNAVTIAQSHDGGTNALLVTPPDAIAFRFGAQSAAAHEGAAQEAGLKAVRLSLPFLSRDIDTPDDLAALSGSKPSSDESFSAFALTGIPEIHGGDDLARIIRDALEHSGEGLHPGDIVVVAQKIVSKAERRLRRLADFTPSAKALEISEDIGKDPRKVEAILSESSDVLRTRRAGADGLIITRHRDGWICANAGIDESNLGEGMDGMLLLLPEDSDGSARAIRADLENRYDSPIGVIIADTFGRPWRQGLVNIAIGVGGVPAIVDWVGKTDAYGRVLKATQPSFADEVAAAAGLLMQKDAGTPVVVLRGLKWQAQDDASARDVLRPIEQELFL